MTHEEPVIITLQKEMLMITLKARCNWMGAGGSRGARMAEADNGGDQHDHSHDGHGDHGRNDHDTDDDAENIMVIFVRL